MLMQMKSSEIEKIDFKYVQKLEWLQQFFCYCSTVPGSKKPNLQIKLF